MFSKLHTKSRERINSGDYSIYDLCICDLFLFWFLHSCNRNIDEIKVYKQTNEPNLIFLSDFVQKSIWMVQLIYRIEEQNNNYVKNTRTLCQVLTFTLISERINSINDPNRHRITCIKFGIYHSIKAL